MKPPVLLIGNQNSGKTSLFNALTGLNSRIANYPGVTVEARIGEIKRLGGEKVHLVDLPGTYSLTPASLEEELTVKALFGEQPELKEHSLVVVVIDCAELRRGLYLYSQLIELGFKAIIALTMVDQRSKAWLNKAISKIQTSVSSIVVPVSINDKTSLNRLITTIDGILAGSFRPQIKEQPLLFSDFPVGLVNKLSAVGHGLNLPALAHNSVDLIRNNNIFLFGLVKRQKLKKNLSDIAHINLTDEENVLLNKLMAQIPEMRFSRVDRWLAGLNNDIDTSRAHSDVLDKFFLQPVLGTIFLLTLFMLMLQTLFAVAEPLSDYLGQGISQLSELVIKIMPEHSVLRSLIVDGVFEGVGSVLSFVPLIALLFLFLSFLEDSGYLARATYLLDGWLKRVGLCGRSLMPMLSGFACAVPAIMATRTIGSRKERLITIMVTPFLSCSARLPVYGLIVGALFSAYPPVFGWIDVGALMFISMYALSILASVVAAFVLSKILKTDGDQNLAIELPPYRWPNPWSVFKRVLDRIMVFVKDVGSVILASTIIIWALFHFEPYNKTTAGTNHALVERDLSNTYAGRIGKSIEPLIAPMGLDWQVGVGIFSSFLAREVFVSTMGVVYGLSQKDDKDEEVGLKAAFKEQVTPLSGFCLLIFFTLSMQCISTIATTKRETGSLLWPLLQFVMMTGSAYVLSILAYIIGRWAGF